MSILSHWTNISSLRDDIQHEGFLLKESRVLRYWRKRWFVLTSEYLYSFKDEGIYRRPTETIRIEDCFSVKSRDRETGREHSFTVQSPRRTFFLMASSRIERETWITAIANCRSHMVFAKLRRVNYVPLKEHNQQRRISLFTIASYTGLDDEEREEEADDAGSHPHSKRILTSVSCSTLGFGESSAGSEQAMSDADPAEEDEHEVEALSSKSSCDQAIEEDEQDDFEDRRHHEADSLKVQLSGGSPPTSTVEQASEPRGKAFARRLSMSMCHTLSDEFFY